MALCFSVASCPSAGLRVPIDCPARDVDVDVAACQARLGPTYGRVASKPLRWGRIGEKRPFPGRLVCPNGSEPLFEAYAGETDAAKIAGVRAWIAHCRVKPFLVFVDETRCGDLCPPPPLGLLSVAAARAFAEAKKLAAESAWDKVAERCREAVKRGAESEVIQMNCGAFFYNAKRYAEARVALDAALRMTPGDPVTRLHRGMVDLKEGRPHAYEAVLRELHATLPENHHLASEVKCKLAVVLRRDGDRAEGERLAAEACQAGRTSCCHRPSMP
ncbi:MAG: hypothetical protein HYY84_14040 [Deltaproteobacteria bacterium]|nr:hypothetical protein [Deltaproteobacteria bacterium]